MAVLKFLGAVAAIATGPTVTLALLVVGLPGTIGDAMTWKSDWIPAASSFFGENASLLASAWFLSLVGAFVLLSLHLPEIRARYALKRSSASPTGTANTSSAIRGRLGQAALAGNVFISAEAIVPAGSSGCSGLGVNPHLAPEDGRFERWFGASDPQHAYCNITLPRQVMSTHISIDVLWASVTSRGHGPQAAFRFSLKSKGVFAHGRRLEIYQGSYSFGTSWARPGRNSAKSVIGSHSALQQIPTNYEPPCR